MSITDKPVSQPPSQAVWGPPQNFPPQNFPPQYSAPALKKRHRLRTAVFVVGGLIGGVVVITAVASAAKTTTHPTVAGVQTNSLNTSHPPQADVNPGWTLVSEGFGSYWKITGTVTNHSSKVSTYTLHFDLTDASGVRVTDTVAVVNEVQAGQTANFESLPFQATNAHATLTKADRYGF
jgi:hypothetical protein